MKKGTKHSEETREKMRISNNEFWNNIREAIPKKEKVYLSREEANRRISEGLKRYHNELKTNKKIK
jgi:hypothetical protein